MTITKTPDAVAVVEPILEHLQQAWNAGDGMGFAGPFAEDADFVEIRGGHHHGAVAVGRGHEAIFSTIYAGSTVDLQVETARNVGPGVVVALVHSTMTAPTGPMQRRQPGADDDGDRRGGRALGDHPVPQHARVAADR